MRRRSMLLSGLLLLGLLGCAGMTADQQRYHAGVISKTVAESSYAAIYRGYTRGLVSEADMQRARVGFDAWATYQHAYVDAMQAGATVDASVVAGLRATLDVLLLIAAEYQLL